MKSNGQDLAADTATLEYAQTHRLHELVDHLIAEVAAARPENPVPFMGAILQKRIATREAAVAGGGGPDAQLAAALSMHAQPKHAKAFPARGADREEQVTGHMSAEAGKPLREQCLAQFGIWAHIRYADVPAVVSRAESVLFSRSLVALTDTTSNMEFLIQMLAAAAATAHYKGFTEAVKLLPTRAVHLTVQVCEALTEAILANAPSATASQRSEFVTFMQHVGRVLTSSSAGDDAAVIRAMCEALQSHASAWDSFVSSGQRSLARLDPIMAVHGHSFATFVRRLLLLAQGIVEDSNDFQLYEDGEPLKRRAQEMYRSAMKESGVDVLPDRFAIFAALFLRSLQHTLGERQQTPTAMQRLDNILGYVMDLVNVVASETYGERRCVRRGNVSVMRGCLRFLGYNYTLMPFQGGHLAGFATAHSQRADALLREAAVPFGTYSEEMAESFTKVAALVVSAQRGRSVGSSGETVLQTEPLATRCYYHLYRSLLQTLASLVRLRAQLTAKDVLTVIARSFCFGAPPGNLFVHFQSAFSSVAGSAADGSAGAVAGAPVTAMEREQAKVMLSALQAVCVLALRSPVMHDIAHSLPLLAESAEVGRALGDTLDPSFPLQDLPSDVLCAFLEAPNVVPHLMRCYHAPSVEMGTERYFHLVTVMAARLRLCRVHTSEDFFNAWAASPDTAPPEFRTLPPPGCEFLSLAMLAAAEPVMRAASPQTIAPAVEALIGVGPAILAAMPTNATALDRATLHAYFRHHGDSSRLFMRAVEDLLRTFPQYRPRLFHTSFSFETIQRSFDMLLMALLRVSGDGSAADAAFNAILKPVATKLRVAGIQPRDFDLFGISLCRSMRASGFPEREWAAFYVETVDRLVALSPSLKPLESYTVEDIRRVVVVQRTVRKRLADREAVTTTRGTALHRLRAVLKATSAAQELPEEHQKALAPPRRAERKGNCVPPELSPTRLDARNCLVLQLSWEAIGPEGQVLSIYHAIITTAHPQGSARIGGRGPPAPDADRWHSATASLSPFERCRSIADNFSLVVAALTSSDADTPRPEAAAVSGRKRHAPGGESWVGLVRELFDASAESFLEKCVPIECVRAFSEQLVENVCEKVGDGHPDIRSSWAAFMGALSALLVATAAP